MTKRKFSIIFSIMFLSLVATEALAAVSFSTLDRNDDGIISWSEWRWTQISFRKKDLNHDGVLTHQEYERRIYANSNRQQPYYYDDNSDYAVRTEYPATYPNYGYNPVNSYNPGYNPVSAYPYGTPGYPNGSSYGYNPGLNPLGIMGINNSPYNNPYNSRGAAQTGAVVNLAGSLISSIMAFR